MENSELTDEELGELVTVLDKWTGDNTYPMHECGLGGNPLNAVENLRACLKDVGFTINRVETADNWISVADRLPEPNTQAWACLLHNGVRQEVKTCFFRPDGYWDEFLAERITHWQPLYVARPVAPTMKGGPDHA